jgi:hypothetical protein
MNHPPYSIEESEEMALEIYTNGPSKITDQIARSSYVFGRMSLSEECKSLQSENERLKEALENYIAATKMKYIEDYTDPLWIAAEKAIELLKALNPTKP